MTWQRMVVLAILLAGVAVGLGFYWPFRHADATLVLPGVVEIQEVRLGSKVGGRVASVEVAEGERVSPGRVLVRFEVPELEAQRDQVAARLRQAEAELAKAKNGPRQEEIDAAQAALDAARARRAKMMAGWRTEELRLAQSEYDTALADLGLAEEEYARAQRLVRQDPGSLSRTDWDAARFNRERTRGRVAAARARLDMLTTGNRDEDKEEAAAEERRFEANHRLLLAGTRQEEKDFAAAQVAELQARLRELDVSLREAEVRAPEPAFVETVAVRPGDVVPPGQPVVKVLRDGDLWVKAYVPETQMEKVRLGQAVSVRIDSDSGRQFEGKVVHVAAESEFTPRNVQSVDERRHQVFGVKIRVADNQGIVKAGMAAEVTFHP